MSTALRTPVDDPTTGTSCIYVSCLRCDRQWHHEAVESHCPECGDRLEAGTLRTAWTRVVLRNGL